MDNGETKQNGQDSAEENTARKPWTVKEFGGKPLWDWLQLLIVPLVIAVIGFWFTSSQNTRQQRIENQRAQQAQNIEDKRAKAERALAKQSAQDEALQAYLDQMSSLMLDKNLLESERGDSVYTLAQARTATVLTRLDSDRNKTVLGFLWNSGLVGESSSVESSVNLFRNIDLRGADLRGRNLAEAPLRGAILDHADLRGATLGDTKLSDAIMSHADLSNASLFGADLRGTHLNDADLSGAILTSSASLAKFESATQVEEVGGTPIQVLLGARTLVGADPRDAANLSGADLSGSDLSDTFLGKADLSEADLTEVDLSRSVLINADLNDADLSDADLSPFVIMTGVSGITPEQLDQQARSLKGAVLPAGEFAPDEFKPTLSLRLSDGWGIGSYKTDKLFLDLLGSSLLGRSQGQLIFSSHIDHVFDPSNPSEQTEVSAPQNVDEWVSWFRQHPNLDTSKPVSVRVGGATGMRVDATLSSELEDYSRDFCGKQPCVPLYPRIIHSSKGYKDRFIILDVKGEIVIIDVSAASAENKFEEFLPKAQKVLDTVEWKKPVVTTTQWKKPVVTTTPNGQQYDE